MAISSVYFNQNNTILSRHNIISASLNTFCSSQDYGPFDFVDVNGNGRVDMTEREALDNVEVVKSSNPFIKPESACYHYKRTVTTEEPSIPLKDLKHWAQNHQTEVVTQNDIPQGFQMARKESSRTDFKDDQEVHNLDPKTPQEIVSQMEPFESGAGWAVDVVKNEFIIYRPK